MRFKINFFVLAAIKLQLVSFIAADPKIFQADNIHHDLFGSDSKYNKMTIPTNPGSILNVRTNMVLTDINNFDSINQHLSFLAWIRLNWYDQRLTWNPEDYGG